MCKSADNPDCSLGDSPWLLQLSVHSPEQSLVIVNEGGDLLLREGIAGAGAVELVETLHTGQTREDVALAIVSIQAEGEGEEEDLEVMDIIIHERALVLGGIDAECSKAMLEMEE